MTKPFRYSRRHPGRPEFPNGSTLQRTGSQEVLTGYIDGQKASDLEERFSNALNKFRVGAEFRVRVSALMGGLTKAHANLPGEAEIDFLVSAGRIIPVMIDGEIAHFMTPYQRQQDEEKTNAVNEFGANQGWHEVIRVPFTELRDQAAADNVVKRIIDGSYVPQFTT